MSNTGPEGPAPSAAAGGGGAGPSSTSEIPAGADAGEGRERSFEELQRELEDVVARLERGDVACVERLQAVELRIEELSPSEGDGT